MIRIPSSLASISGYTASVIMIKGFSILTIPLVARYLSPADYGHLDVAVSVVECVGLFAALGLADTMFRFATVEKGEAQRRVISEVAGSGLLIALVLAVVFQLLAPWVHASLRIGVELDALRAGLIAAGVTGMIELPLAWIRLKDRPGLFFCVMSVRSICQIALLFTVLHLGWGAEGILWSNAIVEVVFAIVLFAVVVREHGISLNVSGLRRAVSYGIPLVGAGLAMFALGVADRWFLNAHVSAEDIGLYGLGTKLALAAPLLLQPFLLWWNAKRIAVLREPGGLEYSARAWGWGVTILLVSAVGVSLVAPPFIHLAMPPEYLAAAAYVPWLVAICVLNELAGLSNVGCYAKQNSSMVLGVNGAAAVVALGGYLLLIPEYGIMGAVGATIFAHVLRIGLFVALGRKEAPIAFPFVQAALLGTVGALLVLYAPEPAQIAWNIAWTAGATLVLIGLAGAVRLIPMNEARRLVAA